ncbi:MAG: zinc ABC transporter substrate-binding protein [Paracoccus sp. (in: a-proteobacteria)]|nr:zinc ABC transporter substrate-binding protein [Paracoccus sp. (in: a-proteobacteria)]
MKKTLALLLTTLATPALAQVPQVVTDIPPVDSLVRQVMGHLGAPDLLLEQGANAHDFQLRPSQARSLQGAGLLVWIGPEMTPWLDRAAQGLTPGAELRLLALPETFTRGYGADEAHDHDHHHDHSHDGTDPHVWLDPHNAAIWLDAIADALGSLDPENAATYAANAATAKDRLSALDTEISARLAPFGDRHYVVFHDAYGYFTAHYGLKPALAVSLGDASDPSAARLRAIQARIAEEKVTCAFPEANHNPALVERVIEGSDVRLGAALDPEGAQITPSATLYAELLGNMATAFEQCLSAD